MKTDFPEAEIIRRFEERLFQPEVRNSPDEIADLLADDFIEFGSSGRIFNKREIIASIKSEPPVHRSLTDFHAKKISSDVILVTYRVARRVDDDKQEVHTLRSSIWKMNDGRWQMIFHQGTPSIATL